MNVLVVLSIIVFLLMMIVGGKKGIRSFLALFLNFGIIILAVFLMSNADNDPILVTILASIAISCVNLFYINEVNSTTKTAFFATIVSIVLLILFILFITQQALIQGFAEEETAEFAAFSVNIGLDFMKIGAAVIIMSTIGAITDAAIAISSPMREIYKHNPTMGKKELYFSGLSIGRDILGTSTNTLFFAFFGGGLALFIWFKTLNYTTGEIFNAKIFSAEFITILTAGIGVILVIPVTAWITAFYLTKGE